MAASEQNRSHRSECEQSEDEPHPPHSRLEFGGVVHVGERLSFRDGQFEEFAERLPAFADIKHQELAGGDRLTYAVVSTALP